MKISQSKIEEFQIHPLGFFYLTLASGVNKLRLHVYTQSAGLKKSNEWHAHEFDLRSTVLAGSLGNELGQFVVGGEESIDEYHVEYRSDQSVLLGTGRKGKIIDIATFTTTSEGEYTSRAGVIHRATSIITPCVTLVEMTHKGGEIFSYGVEETPFTRRAVDEVEASEILSLLSGIWLITPSSSGR